MDKNKDLQLTENFKLSELTRTNIKAYNQPGATEINNLMHLCVNVLQPVRELTGQPIFINSGYRSKKVNKSVGGNNNSQHLKGQAADIRAIDNYLLLRMIIKNDKFDQLIIYLNSNKSINFIHVSYSNQFNRYQIIFK